MIIKTKTLLVLALTMMSLVAGSNPGSIRKLKKEKEDEAPTDSLHLTRIAAKGGGPPQVDIDVKLGTCKKGSKDCEKMEEDGKEVTKRQFVKDIVDDFLDALEKDSEGKDGDDDDKKDDGGRRLYRYCYRYYYCPNIGCYWYYKCSYY